MDKKNFSQFVPPFLMARGQDNSYFTLWRNFKIFSNKDANIPSDPVVRRLKILQKENFLFHHFCKSCYTLSTMSNPEEIIEAIGRIVEEAFPQSFCITYTPDKYGYVKAAFKSSNSGNFLEYFNENVKMKVGMGCEGKALKEGNPCLIYDVTEEERYKDFIYLSKRFNFKTVLSIPFKVESDQMCLTIYTKYARNFSQEEIGILKSFIEQISMAITNTKINKRIYRNLQVKVEELSLINQLHRAILRGESLKKLGKLFIDSIDKIMPGIAVGLDFTPVEGGLFICNKSFESLNIERNIIDFINKLILKKGQIYKEEVTGSYGKVYFYGFSILLQDDMCGSLLIIAPEDKLLEAEQVSFVTQVLDQFSLAVDRKRIMDQLTFAEKLNLLGRLLSGIAHEISGPLCRILNLSEIWEDEATNTAFLEYIKTVREESLRCKRILSDFLSFSRCKEDQKLSIVNVNRVIKDTLRLWKYQEKKRDMTIKVYVKEPLPPTLINVNRLQQVFLNLIVNAYDAMEGMEKSHKKLRIYSFQTKNKNKIRIIFQDNGPGIPPENLKKIFTPFFTTKKNGKGTGLGLSLCVDILRKYGGDLWVESIYGRGANFIVELPVVDVNKIKARDTQMLLEENHSGGKILVVEDDKKILKCMKKYLEKVGYSVDIATNGRESLAKIRKYNYDVIISDIIMPDLRGDMMVDIFKETSPHLLKKLILCTGDVLEEKELSLFKECGVKILYKPFEYRELIRLIEKVLTISKRKEDGKRS